MATKPFKCTNYADCDLALGKETIEIEDGEEPICPGCKRKLEPSGPGVVPRPGWRKWAILAGVVVAVVVAAAWYFQATSPHPAVAESMLTDFFPRLR